MAHLAFICRFGNRTIVVVHCDAVAHRELQQ
jgi:hypothetical protein